jgi:hypothetical protein
MAGSGANHARQKTPFAIKNTSLRLSQLVGCRKRNPAQTPVKTGFAVRGVPTGGGREAAFVRRP